MARQLGNAIALLRPMYLPYLEAGNTTCRMGSPDKCRASHQPTSAVHMRFRPAREPNALVDPTSRRRLCPKS